MYIVNVINLEKYPRSHRKNYCGIAAWYRTLNEIPFLKFLCLTRMFFGESETVWNAGSWSWALVLYSRNSIRMKGQDEGGWEFAWAFARNISRCKFSTNCDERRNVLQACQHIKFIMQFIYRRIHENALCTLEFYEHEKHNNIIQILQLQYNDASRGFGWLNFSIWIMH